MSKIYTGGSVAHTMTSYAVNMGCNPIIFIGQDFAFTDNKYHSQFAEKETSLKFDDVKSESDFYVKGVSENKVRTNLVMNDYRKSMEKIIKMYPNVKFIDATEGGAVIEGTEIMTLEDSIKKYCSEPFSKIKYINTDNKKYTENAISQLNELKRIIDKCLELKDRNEFVKLIIKLFYKDSIFKLLLYNNIYEYFCTTNMKSQKMKTEELYVSAKKELEYASILIYDVIKKIKE